MNLERTNVLARGTGVGLAQARAIIEQHHGAVTVESVPVRGAQPGTVANTARPGGTRFVVILPLRKI